jgi:DNA-binding CsgD family transcriptional regulator
MQAALDWSFELLTEQERAIWPRLAVFAGTWSLEAAEAVASDDGIAACDVFDLVSRLVDKSLVAVDLSAGEARYRLLEVLRQYAWQRLDERHEVEPVRQRHAGYYLMFAEAVEPELRGSNQVRWLERLEQEHDNLRAALRWLVERDDAHDSLRLAGALAHFWWVRDHYQEGRGWLSKVIERADGLPPCAASVKALTGLFMIAFRQGDLATASASAEERLTLARRLGDGQATAWSLTHLAWIAGIRADRASEVALLDEALSLFRDLGDTTGIAAALNALGESARMCRDDQRAVALYEESLAHYEDMDNRLYILTVSHNLAWSLQRLGHISRAAELFRDSLIQSRELDSKTGISISLTGLAGIAAGSGEAALAARLLGAAEALRYSVGAVADEVDLAEFHRAVGAARERVGEQPFEASWKAGSEAPLDDTIDRALAITFADDRLITETGAAYPLSPRELEIARLIAAGSTNARIAAALGISPRTVDKHASNILHKLGLASRHQIAGWLAPHDDPPIGQTDTHT